jgi:ABC-type lipoprotein export system ATPase subunit
MSKKIKKLTIYGGCGRGMQREGVRKIELTLGQMISIVGPTGSGKTMLINDIEFRANKNTPSKRKVIFENFNFNQNPIATISQQTSFFSDLPVKEFLQIHAQARKKNEEIIRATIKLANELTGEKINSEIAMTQLSGGQTRSLLIADAILIGDSPILLLDEIENAGINKLKVLSLLKKYNKIFIFVTHDPRIFLSTDRRIVMQNGAMQKLISTSLAEKKIYNNVEKMDNYLHDLREKIRKGAKLA